MNHTTTSGDAQSIAAAIIAKALRDNARNRHAIVRMHSAFVAVIRECRYCGGGPKPDCPGCGPGSFAQTIASELEKLIGSEELPAPAPQRDGRALAAGDPPEVLP